MPAKTKVKSKPAIVMGVDPPDGKVFRIIEGGLGDVAPTSIVITFDKGLRPKTVSKNTIQVMMFPDGGQSATHVAGTLSYNASTNSAQFIPGEPFRWGVITGFRYEVTVRGSTPNRILDVDGLALDGNRNGRPGGNFTSEFTILFIVG